MKRILNNIKEAPKRRNGKRVMYMFVVKDEIGGIMHILNPHTKKGRIKANLPDFFLHEYLGINQILRQLLEMIMQYYKHSDFA